MHIAQVRIADVVLRGLLATEPEYDIWLLEDVTKVCGALANGLDPASLLKTLGRMGVNPRRFYGGPATPISPHDVDLERGSVHWDIGGRAKVSVVGFRDQNDEIPPDDKNEGDNNENLAQGSSTASTNSPLRSTKSRPRSKTEPIPYRAPESSAAVHQAHQSRRSGRLHVTDDSPASPSSVSSHTSASSVPLTTSALITLLSARDYVLTATEQRMVAMAGLVGLGKLPMWIFARLRTVLTAMDPPSFQSAHHPPLPRHVNDGATVGQQQLGEAERDQSTIAIQMNSFGRVQMAYPLTRFLGRSTEVLMNRFLMRFVFEEDVGRLCKGMSRCVKEGSCVMFVRWDWRSQQEGASGINRLGFPDVGASQKEEEEGPMFKESNIEDFSRYSTAESTSSADSPTLSAESTIADIPPLAQPPAERATAATPIILTSAPIRSISDPPIPSFRRERRQSSSEPCSSTVLQMTGLRDPVSPVAGSSSTSAFSSSDTIATLPPPLPAVSVVAENEPPPQIRLVWTRVLATLVAHPGECMYILALVTPLPTSTGLMPDRSWISDSTLGPVPGDHMFGPGVTDVGVLKGSKSLPSFRGEWFKKESKVGDASAARGGGMGGGDVGLDGGQVARSYSIWRSIKQIWSFWWSLRERLMNVARRLVMGPAPVSTLKMDPENWADDEERSGPSSASSVTGFHGGGMGAGWG
ncbi:hypothetical protein HK101_010995 [Irineochytrium annulatum]|nr:hypothetical protein HK101_010995 [Irineochytrium annulatum]